MYFFLQGESLSYSGDPLQDFTLIRFLDRFVYKNPKKVEQGESILFLHNVDLKNNLFSRCQTDPMILGRSLL